MSKRTKQRTIYIAEGCGGCETVLDAIKEDKSFQVKDILEDNQALLEWLAGMPDDQRQVPVLQDDRGMHAIEEIVEGECIIVRDSRTGRRRCSRICRKKK